ncbi:helix-turn-helix domain-containing protein [Actinomyces sp. Marseille-P3109]|uniref:helix-turn-helix domain-containing protein n=1 Tax=Actinomyces sp. Marseille-P3109 TaxID=2083009 RepID=UPI000D55AA19|nr:helix-turn-helix domain-containing protein [Actinomyces sp. Marseille-P3109]
MVAIVRTTVKELGAALVDARLSAGLTQEELARRSGVSRKWIGAVEAGGRPGAEVGKLFAVLRALGMGVQVAPTGDQPVRPENEE